MVDVNKTSGVGTGPAPSVDRARTATAPGQPQPPSETVITPPARPLDPKGLVASPTFRVGIAGRATPAYLPTSVGIDTLDGFLAKGAEHYDKGEKDPEYQKALGTAYNRFMVG